MIDVDKNLKETTEKVLSTDTKIETAIKAQQVDSLAKPTFASVVSKEVDDKFNKLIAYVIKILESLEESKRKVIEEKDREAWGNSVIIYRVLEGNTKEETNQNDKVFCMKLYSQVRYWCREIRLQINSQIGKNLN